MSIIDSGFAFFGGDVTLNVTIDTDQFIGTEYNLYDQLGQPTGEAIINLTIDGCDVGSLVIDNRFNANATINITMIDTARILGLSPSGGDGGTSEWQSGAVNTPARNGSVGGDALSLSQDINLDMDDGFIFGAGGGGGGGGYNVVTGMGEGSGGGGGGAGQGWGETLGGSGGSTTFGSGDPGEKYLVLPDASNNGTGGAGGGSAGGGVGGDGGAWRVAGSAGTLTAAGSGATFGYDVSGTIPVTVTLTGSDTQANLESANRLGGASHYSNVTFV